MAELDTLHQTSVDPSTPFGGVLEEYDEFGLIREGLPIRDKESSSNKAKWNTKSEAAKRRWANPEYRQKILAKRRANMGEKQSIPNQKPKKVEIGNMDSVTLSSDQKSAEIIKYVRTNQLRSESLVRFRKDLSGWVENMLEDGEQKRKQLNNAQFKMERMKERSMRAREREMRKREHGASSDSGSDTADETVFVDKPTAQSTPFAAKTPLPRSAELVVEKKTSGHSKKTGPTEVTTRQSKSRLSRPTQTIAKARSAADSFGDVTDNSL